VNQSRRGFKYSSFKEFFGLRNQNSRYKIKNRIREYYKKNPKLKKYSQALSGIFGRKDLK
jgi:hypothetical protein